MRVVEEVEGGVAVHAMGNALSREEDAFVAEVNLVLFNHMGLVHGLAHSKPNS